jgi:copper transporter 1
VLCCYLLEEHVFIDSTTRAERLTTAYHFAPGPSDNSGDPKLPPSEAASSAAPVSLVTHSRNRFILSHELTRGVLAGLQTTIHYLLMLVVMYVFCLTPSVE